ncbi:MAG: hypothetical protein PHG48_00175 [Eubacteriales bacterium]|nr:hypothetical protein [Eubacteriales bacterium]
MGENIMWTVVYMAQTREAALELQDLLKKRNMLVRLRPAGVNSSEKADGNKDGNLTDNSSSVPSAEEKDAADAATEAHTEYYEVLVPYAEIDEAHGVIIEKGY